MAEIEIPASEAMAALPHLFAQNPLAREQFRNIVLETRLAQAQEQIALLASSPNGVIHEVPPQPEPV